MRITELLVCGMALGAVIPLPTANAQNVSVKIELRNDARLGTDTLAAASQIVSQIFAHAGAEIVWTNENAQYTVVLKQRLSDEIMRRIPDALGLSPGTDTERGRLAFVMIDRVNAAASGYGVERSLVLGTAVAHELGHLLLFRGHTDTGIMRPWLNHADFKAVRNGQLGFTEQQAELIRRRLKD